MDEDTDADLVHVLIASVDTSGQTTGHEVLFRLSDGELVDDDGNVTTALDPLSRDRLRWLYAIGDRPDEDVMQRYGVRWGAAIQ
jgi:hypothetical protein